MSLLGQDLLTLDEALTDAGGSSMISSYPIENALVELAVQFAGDAAASGGLAAGAQGVFNKLTSSMLSADIDPSDYPSTFGIGNSTIVGENDLIDAALANALSITPTSTVGDGAQADSAVMNFINDNNMTAIDIALGSGDVDTTNSDSSSGSIVVGEAGSGTLTLGDGNNLVFGGQTVKVGKGDNLIFGQGGGETITIGGGNNEVIAAGTGNTINIEAAGQTGINVVYAGSGNDTVNFDVGSDGDAGFVVLPLQGLSPSQLADLDAKALEFAVSNEVAGANWPVFEASYTNGLHNIDWTVIVTTPGSSTNGDQITLNGSAITTFTVGGSENNSNMTGSAINPMANPTENTSLSLPSDYGPVYTFAHGALVIYDTTEFINSLSINDYLAQGSASSNSSAQLLFSPMNLTTDTAAVGATNTSITASQVTASAAVVSEELDALNADPNLTAITLTDSGTPTLNLTAAQAANDVVALNTITNPSYEINITDSAANVSENFSGIAQNGDIASITLTDSGTPTLNLSVMQFEDGYSLLNPGGSITNSTFAIQIFDSVANITDEYYAQDLLSDPYVVGATVVDTVANILDNASAIASDSLVTSVEISDTAENVLANQTAIAALPFSVSAELNDTAADIATITSAQAATLAGDHFSTLNSNDGVVALSVAEALILENAGLTVTGAPVTVEDTSANIAANLDGLNNDANVSSLTVTDNWWSPNLTLTAEQAANDSKALGEITKSSYTINIADSSANIGANILAIADNPHVTSITLTDSGTPTLVVNAAEDINAAFAIDLVTNSDLSVVINDSAANISANFSALNQNGQFASIVLTDSGTPILALDAADAASGSNVLDAISNANFSIAITDSAANVAAVIDELNLLPNLSSISLTDSGTPTLTLTVAQALDDSTALNSIVGNYQVVVSDTAANIDANLAALNADTHISAIDVVSSGANPTFEASTPSTVEKGQSTVVGLVQPAVAGDALTLTQTSGALGTVSLGATTSGGQQILYTAPATISSSAMDNVSYTISEANGGSIAETAAVQLDAGPTAANGTLTIGHGQSGTVTSLLNGLVTPGLAGDVETLTAVSATNGTASLSNGVVTYQAPANGSDTVSYTVQDQLGDVATGSVAVTVDPGPAAANGALTIGHGETQTITTLLNGLVAPGLAGDTETLTAVSATNGTATLSNGIATYVAPTTGSDTINYTVQDQLGDVATGNVAVNIDPGPTAANGTLTIGYGQSEAITSLLTSLVKPGVAGDTETLTAVSATNGAVSLSNGVATYQAPRTGSDTISYTVQDQLGDTATGSMAVTVEPPILANAAYQTVTGTAGADYFKIASYGDTVNGGGGNDVFEVDNATSGWYNAISDTGGAGKIVAGVNNAFIGLTNFNSTTNGVSTIDLDGKSGVVIAGSGSALNLSGVTISDSSGAGETATILTNAAYQTVTGTAGADYFEIASYGDTVNGGGGNDVFEVDNATSGWYNAISDTGGLGKIFAGVNDAFIGLTNFTSGNGVSTIDLNGKSGVVIAGSGSALNLSGVMITDSSGAGETATILTNAAYQTVTGTAGADYFKIASYGDTINGGGGNDVFEVDNATSEWYNVISDTGGEGKIVAGVNDAFIGLSAFASGNDVSTIDLNGKSGVVIAGSGSALNLSGVMITDSSGAGETATILTNAAYQTVTGTAGADYFKIASYGDTINGGGGNDVFEVDNATSEWYNAVSDTGGEGKIVAGVNDAFIGLSAFASGNGVSTIDLNGKSGVVIAGSGSTLNLSGVTIADSSGAGETATILTNAAYQTVTGTAGADYFKIASYGDTINGGGGNDVFEVDNATSGWYNAVSDTGGAGKIVAGVNNAFIGQTNFNSTTNGVSTIDLDGKSGVVIAGSGSVLNLSGVTISDSSGTGETATILANAAYQTDTGTAGADYFEIASYGDTINGGGGSDTFSLINGLSGMNTIQGFGSSDVVDLSNLANTWTNFATLSSHVTQSGANTLIDLGGGRTLTLAGVEMNQLTASEFKFV